MQNELSSLLGPQGHWHWIGSVFVVVFLALTLNFITRRVLNRVLKKLENTNNPWDDALVRAAIRPLGMLVWLLGLSLSLDIIQVETGVDILGLSQTMRDIGVIACLAWFLFRFIMQAEQNLIEFNQKKETPLDRTTAHAIAKLLRISVIITAVLVILQTLGYSVSGVMAFGGIGGIVVGFAARDLLANFFGGLMIYLDRPFAIGDWVRSPDRDIEGTVENIGWRLTTIRTFDKRPLYVPNAVFTSIAVQNPSRMTHRRINETIGVRYDDVAVLPKILADVEAMLRSHPDIDSSQTLMVNFNQYNASSLDFFIYTFTHTTNWEQFHQIKQDVLLQISNIIARHGAQIAFPTRTLHLHNADSEPNQ
ncbi:MAG: mechanosensitive ion channel family protein [Gammaproteobacteria bacterium]|nr:mechanosensitive ion channel family protein [Gammaproteobacteria bacterium]